MEENIKKYPKRPRIKEFDYSGIYSYFITICTDMKKAVFVSDEIFNAILLLLKEAAERYGFEVYAYCFMPDHLHLLLVAESENVSLKEFIKLFKQKSGFYYKQRYGVKLWQPSYYDHVLRKKESLNKITEYIFYNPVRKKLVEEYCEYPYSGSFVFDL